MAKPDIPHIRIPLVVHNGRLRTVEQDDEDHILQCINVVLKTPLGSRDVLPEYGIDEVLFGLLPDTSAITEAISEWEPRANTGSYDIIRSDDGRVFAIRTLVEMNDG